MSYDKGCILQMDVQGFYNQTKETEWLAERPQGSTCEKNVGSSQKHSEYTQAQLWNTPCYDLQEDDN